MAALPLSPLNKGERQGEGVRFSLASLHKAKRRSPLT
jgi:hypothetical protein